MEAELIQTLGASGELRFGISPQDRSVKGYLPKWSWMNLFKAFLSDPAYWGEYESGWLHVQDHFLNGPAFGGLVATSKGVGRFLADQLSENSAIFSESTRRLFMEQQRDLKGKYVPMTAGWHVDELDGETYLYKEGGGMGFHAEMRLYPSRKLGTVLLVNSGSFNTRKNLSRLDRLVE